MKNLLPLTLIALTGLARLGAHAQPFTNFYSRPTLDRWMYPFNATPGTRPSAPTFGTFGDGSGVDTRHGQFLVGWDTTNAPADFGGESSGVVIPAGMGATNYLLSRVVVTAVIARHNVFTYDPTQDGYRTYPSNALPQLADADAGRPVELFGAGFRNGFNVTNFLEDSAFGGSASGGRNAYAAGWSTNLTLVDVSNNCGKTNPVFPNFEVWPFAVGTLTNVAPGQPVPVGSKFTFTFNLADPLVRYYVQQGLDDGRLRFTLTALVSGVFGGQPNYPDFYTRDNFLGEEPPQLLIEGAVIRTEDTDADGLPDDWERFYFTHLSATGAGDADGDGFSNRAEYLAGTDPTQARDSLSPVGLAINAAGHREVRFRFTGGRHYGVDYSTNLVGGAGWQAVVGPVFTTPEPGVLLWVDDGSQTGGPGAAKYYRLRTP
jgi:hypothetical protein